MLKFCIHNCIYNSILLLMTDWNLASSQLAMLTWSLLCPFMEGGNPVEDFLVLKDLIRLQLLVMFTIILNLD